MSGGAREPVADCHHFVFGHDRPCGVGDGCLRPPRARRPAVDGGWFGAMVYDSGADRMVLFGGDSCCPSGLGGQRVLNETWTFDLNSNTWQNRTRDSNPGPRIGHAMAFDSWPARPILFGAMRKLQSSFETVEGAVILSKSALPVRRLLLLKNIPRDVITRFSRIFPSLCVPFPVRPEILGFLGFLAHKACGALSAAWCGARFQRATEPHGPRKIAHLGPLGALARRRKDSIDRVCVASHFHDYRTGRWLHRGLCQPAGR